MDRPNLTLFEPLLSVLHSATSSGNVADRQQQLSGAPLSFEKRKIGVKSPVPFIER